MSHAIGRGAGRSRAARATPAARARDAVPGMLAWLSLVLVSALAVHRPGALLSVIALLAAYLAGRMLLAASAVLLGLRQIRWWRSVDWQGLHGAQVSSDGFSAGTVRHVVIIPNYLESDAVLARGLGRLAEQPHASTHLAVILALEAAEAGAAAKGERLRQQYASRFARVLVTLHPAGDPAEVQCKSANLRWAWQHASTVLQADLGWKADHVLVTSMDADTLWDTQHFAALSCAFAADPDRHHAFFQAPIRYHANVWSTQPLLRLLHAYASAWELAYLAAPWWRALPMSSYSVSWRLLEFAGGWDGDAVADEWHLFIKAFYATRGAARVRPVYLPFLATAPPQRSWPAALRARYWQTFRHAWGAREIGYTLAQMRAAGTPVDGSVGLLLRVAHDNMLASAGWLVLFVGPQLLAVLQPAWLRHHAVARTMLLFQGAVAVIAILTVCLWVLDLSLRPARDASWRAREQMLELASLPLLGLLTLACVALPALHAQTALLLGRPLRMRVTAKS